MSADLESGHASGSRVRHGFLMFLEIHLGDCCFKILGMENIIGIDRIVFSMKIFNKL